MQQRRLLLWAAGIAAVLVLVIFVALQAVDVIAARAIERRGSAMTGTAVRVDDVDISLATGNATVRGLTVANPSGFSTPNAFELGEVHVELNVASLLGNLVMIQEISIGGPRVYLELNAEGRSNVEVIRDAVEAAARREQDGSRASPDPALPPTAEPLPIPVETSAPQTAPPAAQPERRVVIELLALHDGELHVDARAAGGPQAAEKLPGFELTGIGARHGGATPAEAGRIVVAALARDVAIAVAATQVQRYLGKELGGPLGEAIKRGGAEVIEKGLGELLDQMMGK